jgi:hypothetical protein
MSDLQKFYDELMSDVLAAAAGLGGTGTGGKSAAFKENAFTSIVIEDLETAGVLESPVQCYFANTAGRFPVKVNAWGIPEEDTRLDLVIADFHPGNEPHRLVAADIDRAFNQVRRFFELALTGTHAAADPGHEEHAMLYEILSKKDSFDQVHLVLITNGQVAQRKEKERKEGIGEYKASYEIWDIERLRRFRSSGSTHEPIEVDLSSTGTHGLPCVPVADAALGYQTCVTIVPGKILHDWYEEYGPRLLELNVRSYLQAKGKINKEILETLVRQPHQFLAYNNGITIVAEQIDLDPSHRYITCLKGVQIVNGGQTTASIHRAKKENKADLSHVYVQAKITVVPPDQFEVMVPEISRLSNTQNKVSTVDLRANYAYHVGIERVAKKTWAPGQRSMWFYERARGSFQTERALLGTTPARKAHFDTVYPASQRFGKEDLARYCNTWDALPHSVSRGGQKNFERFMSGLKKVEKGWEPTKEEYEKLIGKAILYRQTQRMARELGIAAFAINIVTYTVALLAEKTARRIDLLSIWNEQAIPSPLEHQLRDWLPRVDKFLIDSAGEKNPGEWFKSEQCWLKLKEAASTWTVAKTVSNKLLQIGEHVEQADHEAQNNIARCMAVDAETWFRILVWGRESGDLNPLQMGVANTLSGYAAQGWYKQPSEKQARHGVVMIDLYEKAHAAV